MFFNSLPSKVAFESIPAFGFLVLASFLVNGLLFPLPLTVDDRFILPYSASNFNNLQDLHDAHAFQEKTNDHLAPIGKIFIFHSMQHHGLRLLHKHFPLSIEGAGEMVVAEPSYDTNATDILSRSKPRAYDDQFRPYLFSVSRNGSLRPLEYRLDTVESSLQLKQESELSEAFLSDLGDYLHSHGLQEIYGIETDVGLHYPPDATFVEFTNLDPVENIVVFDRGNMQHSGVVTPTLWEFKESAVKQPVIKIRCACWSGGQSTHMHYEPTFSPSLPPNTSPDIPTPTPNASPRSKMIPGGNFTANSFEVQIRHSYYYQNDLKLQIENINFSKVSRRLERESEWPVIAIKEAILEYRRFLFLAAKYRMALVPSKIVDEVWHAHILHTRDYREDCNRVLGRFLDHRPTYDENEKSKDQDTYSMVLSVYEHEFGQPGHSWIGEEECDECRSHCNSYCKSNCGGDCSAGGNCNHNDDY